MPVIVNRPAVSPFFTMQVSEETENRAKRFRAERQQWLADAFAVSAERKPWVGDLAEIVLNDWLERYGVEKVWYELDPRGKADFLIEGITIEVKCLWTQSVPQMHWGVLVGTDRVYIKPDYYLWARYHQPSRTLHWQGAATAEHFLGIADYYDVGERLPGGMLVEGHPVWHVDGSDWLSPFPAFMRRLIPKWEL